MSGILFYNRPPRKQHYLNLLILRSQIICCRESLNEDDYCKDSNLPHTHTQILGSDIYLCIFFAGPTGLCLSKSIASTPKSWVPHPPFQWRYRLSSSQMVLMEEKAIEHDYGV